MVLVEHLPRLRDVDGFGFLYRPGQFAQPLQIGTQHRTFGAAFAHALQALHLLGGVFVHVRGHAGLVDGLLQLLDFGGGFFTLAEFLLDLAHLLPQHVFALALVELRAGLVADFLGKPEDRDAVAEQAQHLVQAPLEVECLQHRLFLLALHIEEIGDHVGQQRGRVHRLHDADEFVGNVGQQLDGLDCTLLQLDEARLGFGIEVFHAFDGGDARHHEGPALEEFEDTEARLALHHHVVSAIRTGDIAHHLAGGSNPVKVIGTDLVLGGITLQQEADLALGARRLLRGGDRGRAADRDRRHHAGKQHGVAQRHDDHGVVRQRLHTPAVACGLGCLRGPGCLVRREHFLHGGPAIHDDSFLLKVRVRHPSCILLLASVRACNGKPILRWNRPYGISSARIRAARPRSRASLHISRERLCEFIG